MEAGTWHDRLATATLCLRIILVFHFLLFLSTLEPKAMGNMLPTYWVDLPPQLKISTDTPRRVLLCPLLGTPRVMKLTIKQSPHALSSEESDLDK